MSARLVLPGSAEAVERELSSDEQVALYARCVHSGQLGLVEVVIARRQADGSIRFLRLAQGRARAATQEYGLPARGGREMSQQRLDPVTIEEIARRVVELMAARPPTTEYLDTAKVARMLDASEEWVRDHAAELGAVRLGDGPKGALRFDATRIGEALDRRRLAEPRSRPPRRRPGPRRGGGEVELLPLPDSSGVSR